MKNEYRLSFTLFALACILTLILSNQCYLRKDATREKLYTLSSYTLEVLGNLESSVEVSWFRSSSLGYYVAESQHIFDFLNEAELFSNGKIIFKLYNADDVEEKKLTSLGFAAQTIETKGVHNVSTSNIYSGLVVQLKGCSRVLPFLSSISNLEYMLVNFILQITAELAGKQKKVSFINALPLKEVQTEKDNPHEPKIEQITEQLMEKTDELPYIKQWLEYSGFKVEEVSLPIKEELKLENPLIVVGSSLIDADSASYIDVFLKKRGKATFFVSANTIDVMGNWSAKKKPIDPLMELLLDRGIEIESNLVLDIPNFPIKMLRSDGKGSETVNYPFWSILLKENMLSLHPVFAGIHSLQTYWPSSIHLSTENNKSLTPLAKTTKESISMEDNYNTDPFSNLFALFGDEKHKKNAQNIVISSEKPNRMIVVSDENMLGKSVEYTDSTINFEFAVNVALWLSGKDALLELKRKQHIILPFRFYEDAMFSLILTKARILCFLVVPATITTVYLIMRRRRKR